MRETNVVLDVFGTTAYANIILLLVTSAAEYLILIVSTLYRLPDIEIIVVTIVCCSVLKESVCKVVRIESLDQFRYLLQSERCIEVYLGLAFRTALGCYDNDTVGTTSTIDGSRRSILQNIDALNFARSDVADRAYWEAVNDVER